MVKFVVEFLPNQIQFIPMCKLNNLVRNVIFDDSDHRFSDQFSFQRFNFIGDKFNKEFLINKSNYLAGY